MSNVSNEGYVQAAKDRKQAMIIHATVDAAISVALALWTRKGKVGIADMQNEIANRNMKLAEQIHDHIKKFWPYEKAAVDDAFGLARQTAQYDPLATTWSAYSDESHLAYLNAFEDLLADKCICLTPCERANWTRNRQKDRAQVMYFADRVAETRMDALNDMRYAQQYAVLGLGRGHLVETVGYTQAAGVSGNGARNALLGGIGIALGEYSFWRAKPDTPQEWKETEVKPIEYNIPGGEMPSTMQGITSGRDMSNVNGGSNLTKLRAVDGGGQLVRDGSGYEYIMDESGELFTDAQWEARRERMFSQTGDRSYL